MTRDEAVEQMFQMCKAQQALLHMLSNAAARLEFKTQQLSNHIGCSAHKGYGEAFESMEQIVAAIQEVDITINLLHIFLDHPEKVIQGWVNRYRQFYLTGM